MLAGQNKFDIPTDNRVKFIVDDDGCEVDSENVEFLGSNTALTVLTNAEIWQVNTSSSISFSAQK
jgi:CIDE-N domain